MKPLKVQVHLIFEHLTVLYKLTVTTQHRFLIWPQTWKRPSFSISATRSWLLKLLTTEFMVVIKHIDAWLHFALVGTYCKICHDILNKFIVTKWSRLYRVCNCFQTVSCIGIYFLLCIYIALIQLCLNSGIGTIKVHLVIWSITRKRQRKLQGCSGPSLALTKI